MKKNLPKSKDQSYKNYPNNLDPSLLSKTGKREPYGTFPRYYQFLHPGDSIKVQSNIDSRDFRVARVLKVFPGFILIYIDNKLGFGGELANLLPTKAAGFNWRVVFNDLGLRAKIMRRQWHYARILKQEDPKF